MKIYTNTEFKGFYPVGTAAVVVARSKFHAARMLNDELEYRKLPMSATPEQFKEINSTQSNVTILNDGDY